MKLLDELFKSESSHEIAQKENGFIPDTAFSSAYSQGKIPKLPNQLFFQHQDIYISKHSRFAACPEHTHQFLEMNYIYKGSCKQVINGKEFLLKEGDFLLMDTDSSHSIDYMGEDDILINILFQNKDISINWLKQIQKENSILYSLLMSNSSKSLSKNNYIIFSTSEESLARTTINSILKEYFFPKDFSLEIIKHYLPILFYQLARLLPKFDNDILLYLKQSTYANILQIIDKEYSTITLTELANRLNFNKNYLSNMIKFHSKQTFTQLVTQRKLMKAQLLLKTTSLPIHEIALNSGFSNRTYFYNVYQKTFGHLPKVERQLS